MDKFWKWLTDKFQNPLSPLFFILGTLLLILGISTGVSFPGGSQIASEASFRWTSIIIGSISVLLSIFIYYRPPKGIKNTKTASDENLPEEFSLNFNGRRATLSESQGAILNYIVNNGYDGDYTTLETFRKRFREYSKGEMIYRLEHLRLLGFIERQKVGKDNNGNDRFSYRLSKEYQKELGDISKIRVGVIVGNVNVIDNQIFDMSFSCPKCNHDTSVNSKFCLHCGTSLIFVCPLCNSETHLSKKYCSGCGKEIASIKAKDGESK